MFTKDLLKLDCAAAVETITSSLQELRTQCNRRGFVVGVSGGIDSSVSLALCVRAVGTDNVIALQMPERHSSPETLELSALVADHFGARKFHEDITKPLEGVDFYRRYDDAVRTVLPEYGEGWKSKIVLPSVLTNAGYNVFSIVARSPGGEEVKRRMPLETYLSLVAATNFKQRIRKMMEYYYADKHHFAVIGTPNRLEYDQGFFVKQGDGAADIKPIAHLYKTQVYQLAGYLGVPDVIRSRPSTTDTYALAQGQDEFYFSLPYDKMDLCLLGKNKGFSPEEVAPVAELSPEQVSRVYKDIDNKRKFTRYLHLAPLLIEEVKEI